MSEQLFILKDLAYAAKTGGGTISGMNEVNLLAPGAIAIFSANDNTLITTSLETAALVPHKEFFLAVGVAAYNDGSARVRISERFKELPMNPVPIKQAYVAPVKQRVFIGTNGSTGSMNLPTLAAGQIASLKIYDRTGATPQMNDFLSVVLTVKQGETAAQLLARTIVEINAKGKIVTASAQSTTGIQLDAKNFGQTFEVVVDDIFANATITADGTNNSLLPLPGIGTPAQLQRLEFEVNPQRGDTNRIYLPSQFFSAGSEVDTSATYVTYTLVTEAQRNVATMRSSTQIKTIVIAVPSGATSLIADLDTIFDRALFNIVEIPEEEAP